ncbi:MAG: hypothetical protein IJ597_08160, partial [Synergistaceae bacterium]|nr:hypothetical protein [Synergistaceae bacterium]
MSGKFLFSFLILWPITAAFIAYIIGRYSRIARDYFADFVCVIEFSAAVASYKFIGAAFSLPGVCGLGIKFVLDGFRFIYIVIISFMWLVTTFFSREYFRGHRNRNRYYLYVTLTLGTMMGIFLSGDLYTTFLFFEMMSLFSYIMVVQEETPEAQRAAQTYLAIAIIGGLVTLTGLILFYAKAGTLDIAALSKIKIEDKNSLYIPGFLIFVGFAAKAAIFPSHIWLPTAHTAAPAPS